jgi:hypothetical protein
VPDVLTLAAPTWLNWFAPCAQSIEKPIGPTLEGLPKSVKLPVTLKFSVKEPVVSATNLYVKPVPSGSSTKMSVGGTV